MIICPVLLDRLACVLAAVAASTASLKGHPTPPPSAWDGGDSIAEWLRKSWEGSNDISVSVSSTGGLREASLMLS